MQTVSPAICRDIRHNPGRGWMLMRPDGPPSKFSDWPWVSLVYYRTDWANLEPEEGKFAWDWEHWEASFRPWADKGYSVGLDVACCNPHGDVYATPKWVRDAGCDGRFYVRNTGDPMQHGKVMDRWEPNYNDPVFQDKLGNFLAAFAERYDDDPAVEFVTMRSYAPWGEWHSRWASERTLQWMVDTHLRLFRRTQLLIPVGAEPHWARITRPAIDRGVGMRKDGLGGPIHQGEQALFDRAYEHSPVVLEFWGSRQYLQGRGWDVLFDKEECICSWHASRVNMGFVGQAQQWAEDEPDFLDRMAWRLGYQFFLREASFSETAAAGGEFEFVGWFRNDGVAPYVRDGALVLLLRHAEGREFELVKDTGFLNICRPVGHYKCEHRVELPSDLPLGDYDLLLGFEDYFKGRQSIIHLAHDEDEQGRVELGRVKVS